MIAQHSGRNDDKWEFMGCVLIYVSEYRLFYAWPYNIPSWLVACIVRDLPSTRSCVYWTTICLAFLSLVPDEDKVLTEERSYWLWAQVDSY